MRKWIVRFAVLAGIVALAWILRATVWAPEPVGVRVIAVERGRVEATITNSKAGTVEARRRAMLSPGSSGTVVELLVERGQKVQTGELLMRLDLPSGVVRLGQDLSADYPDSLRDPSNPELRTLLTSVDPIAGGAAGSGAEDWADLSQRMHFITELFRSHQEERPLFEPPFLPQQVTAIEEGVVPDGDL